MHKFLGACFRILAGGEILLQITQRTIKVTTIFVIMDQSIPDNGLETEEEDSKVADVGNKDFEDLEKSKRRRMESIGEEDEEAQSYISERSSYLHIPYGFQSRGSYKHASKNCEIVGGRIIFFIIIFIYFIYILYLLLVWLFSFTLHKN